MIKVSGKLTPQAPTCTNTWPGFTSGVGTSSTTKDSGGPSSLHNTARMVYLSFCSLESLCRYRQTGIVQLIQKGQISVDRRQLVAEKITARCQLALVEMLVITLRGTQSSLGNQRLLQPQPCHDHVAEAIEIDGCVGGR